MTLDRITLSHFRNHAASRLDGAAHLNLLVGENGAGKTNVLEALSLLAPGRGLRRAALPEMADRRGDGTFALSAALTGDAGSEPVMLGTGTQPDRPRRRIVQVNGAETSAVSLGEWLAVGWLTPVTYAVVGFLKRREGVEVFDTDTDFSPFARVAGAKGR
jgi:DNA replication and repair protein RecF